MAAVAALVVQCLDGGVAQPAREVDASIGEGTPATLATASLATVSPSEKMLVSDETGALMKSSPCSGKCASRSMHEACASSTIAPHESMLRDALPPP